jgi:hypothetical protein
MRTFAIITLLFVLGLPVLAQRRTNPVPPKRTTQLSPKNAPEAKEALLALEKLQSIVESGVSLPDYTRALADANFPLKMYLKSDKADRFPALTRALTDAMKWYKAAGQLWSAKIDTDFPIGYCDKWTQPVPVNAKLYDGPYMIEDLCTAYPELVTTEADTRHYDATQNTVTQNRKVIRYADTQQKAWQLAGFAVSLAEDSMK